MINLPEKIREVSVLSFGRPSGELSQPSHYQFQYSEPAAPVSLTMNVRTEPFNSGAIHPVFAQNLPEGYVRRYISEKLERHAKVNDLYLLALQQSKGVGHLSYVSEIPEQRVEQLSLDEILTWHDKEPIFPQLLNKYYLGGFASGVQPKVLLNNVKLSVNQQDLIVKTFDDEFPDLTVNEFVCMSAARAAGLNPPDFWLSDDRTSFVIARFDTSGDDRLGVEDFSTLTGKEKYHGTYEHVLKVVELFTRSSEEVARAYRYVVFSVLIGNGDAHLKNFALQYDEGRSRIQLTPPYDITHTLIYNHIDNNMALKLGGTKSFPSRSALIKLGRTFGVKKPDQIIDEMGQSILDYLEKSDEVKLMDGLRASIEKSVSHACALDNTAKAYRHDKRRKYDFESKND